MRLLVRNIYRAFPELDAYSAEQCAGFMKAANQGGWRGLRIALLVGPGFIVACLSATFGGGVIGTGLERAMLAWTRRTNLPEILEALVLFSGIASIGLPCFVAILLLRDFVLRQRVHEVLRFGGKCAGCGHVLIGLHRRDGGGMICPECGAQTDLTSTHATPSSPSPYSAPKAPADVPSKT